MRSFGNNVARSAGIEAVRELGSGGMANICKLLINVVNDNKSKVLKDLTKR